MNQSAQAERFSEYLRQLQSDICGRLEALDGKASFTIDNWTSKLGKGSTRVMADGAIFAKGGVNYSYVSGASMPDSATQNRSRELAGKPFQALGISLVIHPHNPYVPTTHMNLRYFEVQAGKLVWWFGGGYDLTPYYPFDEDCRYWHQTAKAACDPYGKDLYPQFKRRCDEYFYLRHRGETRGIGGLIFDDFTLGTFDHTLDFICSVGDSFIQAYAPIVERRMDTIYGERERNFQEYRRGRYVEFNLLYDRGTMFGLQSGGRTESILMSLPPRVQWHYQWRPEPGSIEEKLTAEYLEFRDWV